MRYFGPILFFLPKNLISWLVGLLAEMQWPDPLREIILRKFAKFYSLDLDEAEKPLEQYATINELFTRRLKPEVRPIQSDWIHPVDSKLSQISKVENGSLIQAKGKKYHINDFLQTDRAEELFKDGMALTYYLCPTDYHRVHSPVEGEVFQINYVPGRLWPVNEWSVGQIHQLFSVNERMILWMKSNWGTVAYVMVGATNVGKMSLAIESELVSNINPIFPRPRVKNYSPTLRVKPGQELGTFNLGSTVIVLYPKEAPMDLQKVPVGQQVRMGQSFQAK